MRLDEILKSSVPFKMAYTPEKIVYWFEIDGKQFKAIFFKFRKATWRYPLKRMSYNAIKGKTNTDNMYGFAFEDEEGNMTVTNKRENVFKIFATLSEILKDFYKNYVSSRNIEALLFAAALKEPSRIKLYNKFVKMIASDTNWKEQSFKDRTNGTMVYIVKKDQQ